MASRSIDSAGEESSERDALTPVMERSGTRSVSGPQRTISSSLPMVYAVVSTSHAPSARMSRSVSATMRMALPAVDTGMSANNSTDGARKTITSHTSIFDRYRCVMSPRGNVSGSPDPSDPLTPGAYFRTASRISRNNTMSSAGAAGAAGAAAS